MDEPTRIMMLGGLAIGALFGVLIQVFRICLVAAIGNLIAVRDTRFVQASLAAWLVAIPATLALEATGLVDIAASSYRSGGVAWASALLGGGLFGIGAALAGGCAARILIRSAEGSLGALLTLIAFAASATATQFGVLQAPRLWLDGFALPLADSGLAPSLGLSPLAAAAAAAAVLLAALLWTARGQRSPALWAAGALIGGLTVAGWYLSGHLAQDPFSPVRPTNINISGGLARGFYSLMENAFPGGNLGVWFVTGMLAAAFALAVVRGQFRFVAPQPVQVGPALLGGLLMGMGAITARGCNIGQGLSGMSTLSLQALLTVAAMSSGIALGVLWWQRRQ